MKFKMFYLLFLIVTVAKAQVINIPDTNLKAALLAASAANSIAFDSSGSAIVIDANGNGQIELSEADAVRSLNISDKSINSMEGLQYFSDLQYLDCAANNLTALNASGYPQLRYLYCNSNVVTTLTLNGLYHLVELDCSYNNIASLDFTGLQSLSTADCSENLLTSLDFSGCPMLADFSCNNNDITTINIKNGAVQGAVYTYNSWGNNPLAYICTDEDEIAAVNIMLTQNGYSGVNVNTYCSLTPGGDYNTITGALIFDVNNNGCGPEDMPRCFVKLAITNGIDTSYNFTNEQGGYNFYTREGDFSVLPDFENDAFYSAAPSQATISFPVVDNSVATQNFCVTPNGVKSDVEVVMVPLSRAVPGQPARYKVVYKNKGNTEVDGTVSCTWNYDTFRNISNVYPAPSNVGVNLYQWNFANLQPFENREIIMTLTVNNTTDTTPVNIGDALPFTAHVDFTGSDALPADNDFALGHKVQAAQQLNYIQCLEGEALPDSAMDNYLHYVISFTNTGADVARNVVISQRFDVEEYDISTLEVLNSSHPTVARLANGIAQFTMEGANVAEGNGHGDILIKIKPKRPGRPARQVNGMASITFDYEAPISTNTETTVFETLSVDEHELDISVVIYPNPASGIIKIAADNLVSSVELYDIQGRLLQAVIVNDVHLDIDLSARASGLYFVKVRTEKGIKVEKIIKQ
ncbi:DUF7619 domain-containing protein [Flavobacterium psychrotrophum]|uniref:DUF7619 domain-containing protein n=1 Tax=Flavobacterium psychrotrophum TaxID=2294119 RepID=UPI000E3152FE|nr:T9SS type A sorting domain-containing protein [Flavobacterium psychrotrophum]